MLKKELLTWFQTSVDANTMRPGRWQESMATLLSSPLRTTQTSSRSSLRGPRSRIGSRRIRHPVWMGSKRKLQMVFEKLVSHNCSERCTTKFESKKRLTSRSTVSQHWIVPRSEETYRRRA
ncbi:TPA: hypothetical protein N0F65_006327 [Lagenidium giganteum]|uniref:Uncharacterized protein n=1 Tax=Lagenidium giganteum TaxID=4803 RepID=A0AAV2YNR8_9STRA|nr:TPA: hypothetical protein N0F65_006327 [Lagenidium giganteum]